MERWDPIHVVQLDDTLSDLECPDITVEDAALRSMSTRLFPSELVLKSGGSAIAPEWCSRMAPSFESSDSREPVSSNVPADS